MLNLLRSEGSSLPPSTEQSPLGCRRRRRPCRRRTIRFVNPSSVIRSPPSFTMRGREKFGSPDLKVSVEVVAVLYHRVCSCFSLQPLESTAYKRLA